MKEPHICHKCGGEGICLGSQDVAYSFHGYEMKQFDYECEDCQATWDVTFELVPTNRDNHE
jgi:hypothetical protein